MRLVKVSVRNFQAIERADVEFGRGLNILFGPNDLGKSTIACAIRAALLVPPSSAEASRYLPWFVDATPEVTLTFTDDDQQFWRVRKTFGATSPSADLHHSKDGITFTHDRRGREVEEQLRKLLGWGVASPGGKGAPRKLPTSFLAQVLIAEQSEVIGIFEQSTAEDGTSSGRDRLRKALAALAEDPAFKKVLLETQKKIDALFTPTGQRKRGRGSPFALIAEDLERRSKKLEDLKKGVDDSRATEENIARLTQECEAARDATEEAAAALFELRKQLARMAERSVAEEKFSQAKAAVDRLIAKEKEVADGDHRAQELEAAALKAAADLSAAQMTNENAVTKVRSAEDALRTVSSEDGARQRELLRAKLGEERAEIASKVGQAEQRRASIEAGQSAIKAANEAREASKDGQREFERATEASALAERQLVAATQEIEIAHGIVLYGQWQAANTAAEQVADAKEKAAASRTEAELRDAAADIAEQEATNIAAEVKSSRDRLPDAALTKRIEDLEQQIAIAEAALGGGLSLALRGSGQVPVFLTIDGSDAVAGTAIDGRIVLEANRTAHLRLGELFDVEIVAGAAEKRRAVAALKERWGYEAAPLLERAGAKSPAEIRERLHALATLQSRVDARSSEANHLRMQAKAARDAALTQEQWSESLALQAREAQALRTKIDALDAQVLASGFSKLGLEKLGHGKLGSDWKARADSLVAEKDKAVSQARAYAESARRVLDLAKYHAAEAAKTATAKELEAARVWEQLALAENSPHRAEILQRAEASLRSEIATLRSRQAAIEGELQAIEQQASSAVAEAAAALDAAKAHQAQTMERQRQASETLHAARSMFDAARGTVTALRKGLESEDRVGAEERLREARSALEQYANDPLVSQEQVRLAEQRDTAAKMQLELLRTELNKAEGALTKVGGVAIREELAREEDAYGLAKEQQRELEIDADAWKLLRETLDSVEKEGSTHLGRSLATPVSARLVELTKGRYSGLRLDQHLRTEAVDVALVTTDDDVLSALSVGTRDQIATLLRLTVAEQLKSAVVLDDHLVHTDPERLAWFRELLRKTALTTQVIVLTCRPQDYLASGEYPETGAIRDLAGGMVRAIDAAQVLRRWQGAQSPAAPGIRSTS